jgi:hypothetical protein
MPVDASPERAILKRRVALLAAATLAVAATAWIYAVLAGLVHEQHVLLIPFSFVSLGMLVKYGDEAFDTRVFSRKLSTALSVPCGVWMGFLILYDPGSATILIGLLLALLVAAKYDNEAFRLGFLVAGAMALASFIRFPDNASLLGVLVVFLAAYADEVVSDMADVRSGRRWDLLRTRPILKGTVLLLCLVGILPSLLYFFAFLGFDLGYSFVEAYADLRRYDHPAV